MRFGDDRRPRGRLSGNHGQKDGAQRPQAGINIPRVIKRTRRTNAEMEAIRAAIFSELEETHPQTVRHVFYRMVAMGVVPKQEKLGYETVKLQLLKMRKSGRVPWGWVGDSTRWRIKPTSYGSLEEALQHNAEFYRRDIWRQAEVHVEIWCESDSIGSVIVRATRKWDVPLMTSRGFSSATYLYDCAQDLAEIGRPAHLYYFGDWDPSGKIIPQVIERDLRKYAPDAEIHFERIAITQEQIREYDLPTKPPKKSTHSKTFSGGTVEIEALQVSDLLALVNDCIERHIDPHHLKITRIAERSERALLEGFLAAYRKGDLDGAGGEA